MKQIPLTRGMFALVDDADYDELIKFKWHAVKHFHIYYAVTNKPKDGGGYKILKMHRHLLGLNDPNVLCDHRDGNGLNNQRENLRACDRSENTRNAKKRRNNTTGFKGVGFKKETSRFYASICFNRKSVHLGYYSCAYDAAIAYDSAAKYLHGEFARLNFPQR